MAEQILLPGFEPEPELTDRLFFAVLPDQAAIARIAQLSARLRSAYGLHGRALDAGRLHVSLCGLGDHPGLPQQLLAHAGRAADTVALAPFSVSFDSALTFANKSRASGGKPFVLCGGDGVAGLTALHQALALALRAAGLHGPLNITPHLTMLYDGATIAPQAIEPVEWQVREFVLIHSRIGQNLPYTVLRRWPLAR